MRSGTFVRILLVTALLLSASGVLSACWSRHELNDLSIVVGLGIDKQGKKYKVTAQIVNPGQVSTRQGVSNNFSPVITYEAIGKTVPDALTRMTAKAARQLYLSHLRILIIGEEVAREGIGKPLDFMARDRELRTDFFLVVAKGSSAEELLNMYSPIDPIPSNNFYTKLETSDRLWAATGKITLDMLIQELYRPGKSPALTALEIVGDSKKGDSIASGRAIDPVVILKYNGMAAFVYDKMVGWMNENDTKVLNYLQNTIVQTNFVINCPDGSGEQLTLQVVNSHSKTSVSYENGEPVFHAVIRNEVNIQDINCPIDIMDEKTIKSITELANKRVEQLVMTSVKKAQTELKADIYGFGEVLHRKNPKLWKTIPDWNKRFATVKVTVRGDNHIRRIGSTVQSIEKETKR
ncbi:Ger(x)C family spore germination protein [Paenibacillus sp. NPDC058071]|uniref:Ger(x)C family spore germination protein n=1 Tax=Paenibacillus sp. NPDC058071 TaxID=3346326 RepID=UPI0036DA9E53